MMRVVRDSRGRPLSRADEMMLRRKPGSEKSPAASDVMMRHPKTLPANATVSEAAAAFSGGHTHMLLLTQGRRLIGTMVRADLTTMTGTSAVDPALPFAQLRGRTVPPEALADMVERAMVEGGMRRLAVVAPDGMLIGLVCLKRRGRGFCSDRDVTARTLSRYELA